MKNDVYNMLCKKYLEYHNIICDKDNPIETFEFLKKSLREDEKYLESIIDYIANIVDALRTLKNPEAIKDIDCDTFRVAYINILGFVIFTPAMEGADMAIKEASVTLVEILKSDPETRRILGIVGERDEKALK